MEKTKMIPPDGGWGWVVVFASALSNIFVIPIIQSFGLLFRDTFHSLGFSHTDGSIILNVNNAFTMLTGIIHGALLNRYGYRKVAVVGSLLIMLGVVLTSFATTFVHYMIYYGLLTSFGMGLSMSAFSLAVNSYFKEKRNKAMSICMTLTGFGPVLLPQLISYLLSVHTAQGATLIIGGLAGNSLVAAFLLQPIKWHMKEEDNPEVELLEKKSGDEDVKKEIVAGIQRSFSSTAEIKHRTIKPKARNRSSSIADSSNAIDHDQEIGSIYGTDTPTMGSILSLGHPRRLSNQPTLNRWWSTPSIPTVNLQSSMDIFNENPEPILETPEDTNQPKKRTCLGRFWWNLVNFFDLTLLLDPIYVNIMLGMSLAVFAELNFSVLTPFILEDFGLDTSQSATFLSLLSMTDIAFRFCAPYIGDFLKKPPRMMYMLTLILLILTRFSLLLFSNYYHLLIVALGLGVAKGIRTVYMSLVIPSYVPIERLASAAGIQMMVNGICILVGGPLLGLVRDKTGSYKICIVIMNFVTLSCIILWTSEILYFKFTKKSNVHT